MPTYFNDQVYISPTKWQVTGFRPEGREYVLHWVFAIQVLQLDDTGADFRGLYHNGLGINLSRSEALKFPGIPLAIKIPCCPNCGDRTRLIPRYRTFRFACSSYPKCRCWIAPTFDLLISDTDAALAQGILELSLKA